MLETYQAILGDNRIEWTGEGPRQLSEDQPVRVQVTFLDRVLPAGSPSEQGQRMAAALESLAARNSLTFGDVP